MAADQGTDQWHIDRAGCATASCFADIIAVSKSSGKPLKAREDYMWKLAGERFYGTPTEQVFAKPMEWGKDLEPYARQAYEVETGNFVIASGFVPHTTIPYCGASPDGLIMTMGGLEIKCPKDRRVHMQTWLNGMPPDHIPQVQGNIWVNNREWWDFVSYDPRAPQGFRLYVQRVPRDHKYILALESHVVEFLGEVDGVLKELYARKDRDIRGPDIATGGPDSGPMPTA